MAADGRVVIDFDMPLAEVQTDTQKMNQILEKLGEKAGDKFDESFSKNAEKVKTKANQTSKEINDKLGKDFKGKAKLDTEEAKNKATQASHEIKSKLEKPIKPKIDTSEAKRSLNELDSSANKFKDRLNGMKRAMSNMPFHPFDRIKQSLTGVDNQTHKTESKFSHFRDLFRATFIGGIASNAVSSAWGHLTGWIGEAISSAKQYSLAQQTMNATWLTLTGNANKGQAMVSQINKMAIAANNSTAMVDQLSQKFYAIDHSATETGKLTHSVLLLQDAFGQTDEAVENFGTQFGQMMANGKVSAQDMMSFVNTFPVLRTNLLKTMRVQTHNHKLTMKQMNDLMSAGKISSKTMIKVVEDTAHEYRKSTDNFSKTIPGMVRTIKTQMPVLLSAFTTPWTKLENPIIKQVNDWITSSKTKSAFSRLGKTMANGVNRFLGDFIGSKNKPKVDKKKLGTLNGKLPGNNIANIKSNPKLTNTGALSGKLPQNNVTRALKSQYTAADALNAVMRSLNDKIKKFFDYLDNHAKDIKEIGGALGSIIGQVAKGVWKDFSSIIKSIGKMFGITAKNGKGSASALHVVADFLDHVSKNKLAMKALTDLITLLVAKKIGSPFAKFGVGLGSNLIKGVKNLKAFRAGIKGLDLAEDATKGEKAWSKFGGFLTKSFKGTKGAISALHKGLHGIGDDTPLTKVSQKFFKLGDSARNAGKLFKTKFSDIWSNSLTHVTNGFSHLKNGASKAWKLVKAGADGTKQAFSNFSDSFKNQVKIIKDGIGGLGNSLLKGAKSIANQARSAGHFLGQQISAGFNKSVDIGKGLFGKGNGAGKLNGLLQSAHSAGGFKKLSTAGRIGTVAAGAGVALDAGSSLVQAFKDRHSADKRSQDIGKGLGAGIGGGIGLWFGGPIGAALGAKIGGIVGKWGGQAVNKFTKGWQSKKPPKKFWSLANLGWSAHSMWNGFTSSISKTIKWFKKHWKAIAQFITHPFSSAFKALYKHNKKFRNWVNGMVRGFKNAWKGIGKWFGNLGKGIQNAWKGMTSWFGKLGSGMAKGFKGAWNGVTKFFGRIGDGIKNVFKGIYNFFKNTIGKVIDGFNNLKKTAGNIGSNVGKFFTGKLKVSNLHLAGGTNWKERFGFPAVLNDGNDSPSTNNREGLIHRNGTLEFLPNIRNLKRWILPGEEVVNARDMATLFGRGVHLADGTVRLNHKFGGNNSGERLLKSILQTLKQIVRSIRIKFKVKSKPRSKGNSKDNDVDTKGSTDSSGRGKGSGKVGKEFKKLNSKSDKQLKTLNKNTKKHFTTLWSDAKKQTSKGTKKVLNGQDKFGSKFKKGWHSIDSGTHSIYSKFWTSMHKTAGRGMNNVLDIINDGIKKIDHVISDFGGNGGAIKSVGGVKFATGTGYFSNVRRPITRPTLAMVNDGNDSPETGNREALFRPSTGQLGIFNGTNIPTILMPGDEILNATEARELGLTAPKHFATGTGLLKQLYEQAKRFYRQPVKTGQSMFTDVSGLHGAIESLAKGMTKTAKSSAVDWWSDLWQMVKNKIDDGSGPATGLLKAVEKYGEGHRYVWATAGPSTFDCSGLVMYALKKAFGIAYPHFSGAQYAKTQHLSRSQAKPGDLVFWGSGGSDHVGVFAGGNKYFSAQSPSQGIHMNTLDSVVGKGKPLFGRVRGLHQSSGKEEAKVKATTKLDKQIRDQVGKGFWYTIGKIADKYGSAGQYGNPSGDGANRWRGLIKKAASAMNVSLSSSDMNKILTVIAHESGGNPKAVNGWDSNAKAGHPSKGILQFVDGTFQHYAVKGHHNILNGFDQLLAMFNDSTWRRDLTLGGWGPTGARRKGYRNGGKILYPDFIKVAEDGPESVVNAAKPSADWLIPDLIKQRAIQAPDSPTADLAKLINFNDYKYSKANGYSTVARARQESSIKRIVNGNNQQDSGDINLNMNVDGKTIANTTYPINQARQAREINWATEGGSYPVD